MLHWIIKIPLDLIINLKLDKYETIEKPTIGNAIGTAVLWLRKRGGNP